MKYSRQSCWLTFKDCFRNKKQGGGFMIYGLNEKIKKRQDNGNIPFLASYYFSCTDKLSTVLNTVFRHILLGEVKVFLVLTFVLSLNVLVTVKDIFVFLRADDIHRNVGAVVGNTL